MKKLKLKQAVVVSLATIGLLAGQAYAAQAQVENLPAQPVATFSEAEVKALFIKALFDHNADQPMQLAALSQQEMMETEGALIWKPLIWAGVRAAAPHVARHARHAARFTAHHGSRAARYTARHGGWGAAGGGMSHLATSAGHGQRPTVRGFTAAVGGGFAGGLAGGNSAARSALIGAAVGGFTEARLSR